MTKSAVYRDDSTGDLDAGGAAVEVAGVAGIAGEFKRFNLSTAQLTAKVAAGLQVEWDEVQGVGEGILLDTTVNIGVITLPAGGQYVLHSGVRFVGLNAGSEHTTSWYDITGAAEIGNKAVVFPQNSVNPSGSSGIATAHVDTAGGAVEVEVRTTATTDPNQLGTQSWATVQRIDVSGRDVGIGRALHDTTHAPIALWQLGGSVADTSGNGRNLTQVGVGEVAPGHVGLAYSDRGFTGKYLTRAADASLQILGAVSGMCIVKKTEAFSGGTNLIFQQGLDQDGAEANNILYSLYFNNRRLNYHHQYGAGLNETHQQAIEVVRLNQHEWMHLAFTRAANGIDVIVYLNGEPVYVPPVVNAPTGGSTGTFDIASRVAIPGGNALGGDIQSVKIVAAELTAADIKAEYNRCFGVAQGIIASGTPIRLQVSETAVLHDYAPTGWSDAVTAVTFDLDADYDWTGIDRTGITDGLEMTFVNRSVFTATIRHQNTGSLAGNRIESFTGGDVTMGPRGSVRVMSDDSLNGWRIV